MSSKQFLKISTQDTLSNLSQGLNLHLTNLCIHTIQYLREDGFQKIIKMASSSHVIDPTSDKNCKSFCPLELGCGETFEKNLMHQQTVKASNAHAPPQIFSDPNDQALYSNMLNDVMYNIIDKPEEHKVFRAALEGMNRNYPEILNGQEKNMFYSPTAFNFDSRIGKLETSVPKVLEEMQAALETKQSSNAGIQNTNQINIGSSTMTTPNQSNSSRSTFTKTKQWISKRVRSILPGHTSVHLSNSSQVTPSVQPSTSSQNTPKSPLTPKEMSDLKIIQNHLRKIRPQLAEQEFIDALACFFYQKRGIFIHSLKLDQHL